MNDNLPRTLELNKIVDFLVGRLDKPVRIQASSEAVEFFRRTVITGESHERAAVLTYQGADVRFEVEPNPYRHNGSHYVLPYIDVETEKGRIQKLNPDWLMAPYELVIGYGLGGMQAVSYKRDLNGPK